MSGLSTIGIISFGLALVAGRNRLPMPATGNTALVMFRVAVMISCLSSLFPPRPRQRKQAGLVQYGDPQFHGPIVLAPRISARHNVLPLSSYRTPHLAARRFDQ